MPAIDSQNLINLFDHIINQRVEPKPGEVIRRGTANDLQRGLLESLENLRRVGLTAEQATQYFAVREWLGNITFVTEYRDQIVCAATVLFEQKLIKEGGRCLHVEDVATNKRWTGNGFGRRMVNHIQKLSAEWGCYKVILDCDPKMRAYYESMRFYAFGEAMRYDVPHAA